MHTCRAFLPTTVDGLSLKETKEKRKNEPPKKRLQDSSQTQEPKQSKPGLQWVEVLVGDSCNDFLDSPDFSQTNPSSVCQGLTVPILDLRCLCVLKNGVMKNVCGTCSMTLKYSK